GTLGASALCGNYSLRTRQSCECPAAFNSVWRTNRGLCAFCAVLQPADQGLSTSAVGGGSNRRGIAQRGQICFVRRGFSGSCLEDAGEGDWFAAATTPN